MPGSGRLHRNFGLKLGYFRTREESKNIAGGAVVGPGTVATADFENVADNAWTYTLGLNYTF